MSHLGKRLRSGEKDIIMNVRAFFETEKRKGRSILQNRVLDRTAKATKIGKTTIKAITKEYRGQGKLKAQQRGLKKVESKLIQMNLTEQQLDARYTTFIPPKNTLLLINCLKSYMTKTFSMVVAVHSQRYLK